MLKNYLKTALRNLLKNKAFSAINIFGLAVALSVSMLVALIIYDQFYYDRFHPDGNNIYRIISDRTSRSSSSFATTPLPLYDKVTADFPGIASGLRILNNFGGDARIDDRVIPLRGAYADANFFDMFGFALLHGDPASALLDPYSVILTEEEVEKFDLDPTSAVGKILSIGDLGEFTITGIMEKPPGRSHMEFDALASFSTVAPLIKVGKMRDRLGSWFDTNDGFVYLKLKGDQKPGALESLFPAISEEQYAASEDYRLDFRLQALHDVTPREMLENDLSFSMPKIGLYFLSILGLIIMISAGFNYTNLSIARALVRAKEVGIRKVIGAKRGQIFLQFLVEAIVLALISMTLAWGILEVILIPGFKSLSINEFLNINFDRSPEIYLQYLGLTLLVGMGAGFFPAIFFSKYKPLSAMKNLGRTRLGGRQGVRKALIVVQFVLSLVLIISTTLYYQQTRYLLDADYGFEKDFIVNLDLQGNDYPFLKEQLIQHAGITAISGSSLAPATGSNSATSIMLPAETEDRPLHMIFTDEHYLSNLEIPMVAGLDFDKNSASDPGSASDAGSLANPNFIVEREVIINETAARELFHVESPLDALGKTFDIDTDSEGNGTTVQVRGVVKDFHYRNMEHRIGPLMLRHIPGSLRMANLKVHPQNISETLTFIEETWKEVDNVHAVSYAFFDEQIGRIIRFNLDLMYIIGFVAFVAIVIACLGLLGIATFSAETCVKEIGIRKIMGASIRQIIGLLSQGFVFLLLIATVIALPIAWFINQSWIDSFAYSIEMTPLNVGFGIVLMLGLGILTVASQAIRAAVRNPVDALRDE